MIFRSHNPKGADSVYYMPYIRAVPNGDYALKGDEWQTLPITAEIMKLPNAAAIYRDSIPVYA